MIRVKMQLKDNCLTAFCATGHAGFGKKNSDIVCAAFTVLVRTIWRFFSLHQYVSSSSVKDGFLSFSIKEYNDEVFLITKLLILGLNDLQHEFPQRIYIDKQEI